MLDALAKIATTGTVAGTSGFVDISAAVGQLTAVYELGRVGLPRDCWFLVHLNETSAQAAAPVVLTLQVSDDNGSTYNNIASVTLNVISAKAIVAVPCGPVDLRQESIADANLQVRIIETHAVVASADDISYDAYLCGPQSQRAFN